MAIVFAAVCSTFTVTGKELVGHKGDWIVNGAEIVQDNRRHRQEG